MPQLLSPELITVIISAIPVLELRGGILYARALQIPALNSLILGIIGSMLPVIPILILLGKIEPLLRRNRSLANLLDRVYARTRSNSKLIQEYEFIGLTLFIGVPLPGTGVWTGMLAAYLLGLPRMFSFLSALLGTTIAGIIMLFLSDFKNLLSILLGIILIVVISLFIKFQMSGKNEN